MAAEGFRLNHGSNVYVIRACYNEDGADLLALGGEHSVEVYQIVGSSTTLVLLLHSMSSRALLRRRGWQPFTSEPESRLWLGLLAPSRPVAVMNGSSSSSRSPSSSILTHVCHRLAAASIDFGLHLLTRSSTSSENIFPFGGGLSGHHGKINDICFCGGRDLDSARYVATVSGKPVCPSLPQVSRLTLVMTR